MNLREIESHRDEDGWDSVWLEVDGPDALDELVAEVRRLRAEASIAVKFCDGYGDEFSASVPEAARKFSIIASRLDRALSADGNEEGE